MGFGKFLAVFALAFGLLAASGAEADRFRYKKSFTLKLGETVNVYAVRHRDCESMPSFESIEGRLPDTVLGGFPDGARRQAKAAPATMWCRPARSRSPPKRKARKRWSFSATK